jgi:SAM-dependent methyltransferase
VVGAAPIYDGIGRVYARHRRPDPRISAQVDSALGAARTVVDVGAGTGSYEPDDRRVVAVEPSLVMTGQRAVGAAPVVRAVAEHLPFADGAFDAAMAVLTIHHWSDAVAGLREMTRVGRGVAVLTFDPVVHATFWMFIEYLPEVTTLPLSRVVDPETVAEVIGADRIEPVLVPSDCVDGFNVAFWHTSILRFGPACQASPCSAPTWWRRAWSACAQTSPMARGTPATATCCTRTPSTVVCVWSFGTDRRRAARSGTGRWCARMSASATKGAGEWASRTST